jgi:hypothetical protein
LRFGGCEIIAFRSQNGKKIILLSPFKEKVNRVSEGASLLLNWEGCYLLSHLLSDEFGFLVARFIWRAETGQARDAAVSWVMERLREGKVSLGCDICMCSAKPLRTAMALQTSPMGRP